MTKDLLKYMVEHAEDLLRRLFLELAYSKPKKHGTWRILQFRDGTFLQMDTWNGHLTLKVGSSEYNYWTGFSGKTVYDFGLNKTWDRNKTPLWPVNVYFYYIDKIIDNKGLDDFPGDLGNIDKEYIPLFKILSEIDKAKLAGIKAMMEAGE